MAASVATTVGLGSPEPCTRSSWSTFAAMSSPAANAGTAPGIAKAAARGLDDFGFVTARAVRERARTFFAGFRARAFARAFGFVFRAFFRAGGAAFLPRFPFEPVRPVA